MRWTIGIDVRPTAVGALAFGKWLHETSGSAVELSAVHVVEDAAIGRDLNHMTMVDIVERADQAMHTQLEARGAASLVGVPAVVRGLSIATTLGEQARGGMGLIVGRNAAAEDSRIIRLGRIARQLVRRLPTTIVVVPPDLERFGQGPIILATDLSETSVGAAHVAQGLAQALDRPLLVASVSQHVRTTTHYLPADKLDQLYRHRSVEQGVELRAWMKRHGLRGTALVLPGGDVVDRMSELADREDAPLVVCGSRQLSLAERVFSASVGSTLAAFANRPIAVVPPDAASLASPQIERAAS